MSDSDSALPPDDPETTSPEAQDQDQIIGPLRRRVTLRAEPISLNDQPTSGEPYIITPARVQSPVLTRQQTLEWYRRKTTSSATDLVVSVRGDGIEYDAGLFPVPSHRDAAWFL